MIVSVVFLCVSIISSWRLSLPATSLAFFCSVLWVERGGVVRGYAVKYEAHMNFWGFFVRASGVSAAFGRRRFWDLVHGGERLRGFGFSRYVLSSLSS